MKIPMWVRLCAVLVTASALVAAAAAVVVLADRRSALADRAARAALAERYAAAGDDARAAGDRAMAGRAFASALDLRPGDMTLRARLAAVHVEQMLDGSEKLTETSAARLQLEFSERLLATGRDARTLAAFGKVLSYRGQGEAARERLREAIALDPGLAPAHVLLAEALLRAEEWTGAAASAERALAITPDDPAAHLAMAQAQAGLGAMEVAALHYGKAAEKLDEPAVWQALGRVELGREKWAEAEAAFARVLARRPDANGVYADYGRALARLGRLQPAARFFERAYRELGDLDAYAALGDVALKGGDFAAAVKVFGELASARADDPEVTCRLGFALEGAGQPAAALAAFTRCGQQSAGIEGRERLAQAAAAKVEALRAKGEGAGEK
ncbi:MAG: tetratricopeptide repeat protein [bacterium]|nr:tetratricopeptide repeat protein [Myxococcales bacterium]MCB9542652.1 tetratricopeptide repeat protein [Myxococcales bacterium]MCB9550967.1 tetratricopeptide repeat protein [Myxococcales bacterium]